MIAPAGGESRREVIISLKAVADPDNARTVKGLQDQVAKIQGDGARQAAQQVKAATDDQERAVRQAQKVHEESTLKISESNRRMGESFKGVLEGTLTLSRGIAMLGLVGEDDLAKLLRGLIRIQAAFDVMKGSIELVLKMKEMWQAYTVAVQAAAVAHGTLAAAQATSGITAGPAGMEQAEGGFMEATGASFLGGAVGGRVVARRAARRGLGVGAMGLFTAALKSPITQLGLLAAGAAYAGTQLFDIGGIRTRQKERWSQLPTFEPEGLGGKFAVAQAWARRAILAPHRPGRHGFEPTAVEKDYESLMEAREQARQAAQQTTTMQRALEHQRFMEGRREWQAEQRYSLAERMRAQRPEPLVARTPAQERFQAGREAEQTAAWQRDVAQRLQAAGATGEGRPLEAEQEAARQAHLQSLQEVLRLRREELQIIRQGNESALQGLKDQVKLHQSLAEQIREQARSAVERFGAADPATQARLLQTARAARAGQELTRKQISDLERFRGVAEFDEAVARSLGALAVRGGAPEFFGGEYRATEAGPYRGVTAEEMEQRAGAETRKARQIEARIRQDYTYKVELLRDDEGMIRRIVESVDEQSKERDRYVIGEVNRRLDAMEEREHGRISTESSRMASQRAVSP